MFKKNPLSLKKKTPYLFGERVLTACLPAGLMLLALALAQEVDPLSAILAFALVFFLMVAFTLPFFTNLQNLEIYTNKLAQDEDISDLPEISSLKDESARIVSAINQMRNIWASKAEQLQAQTLSDAAVLDSLPDPLLMLDDKGVVIGANLSARQNFGFNIRSNVLQELINLPVFLKALSRILDKKSNQESLEIFLNNKFFNAKIARLPAQAKGGAVAVVALVDMTVQKQLEQMQADFVANASHELRTPLSVLSGFIETLQTSAKEDPQAQEEFLKIMNAQALRMSNLIESLLSLSRIQMNENEKPMDLVDIPEILKTVQFNLEPKASKNGTQIVLKACAQNNTLLGNNSELTQVFQNIVDNALKYGQKGGVVTISSKIENDFLVVNVHNTGETIPQKELLRLSERFYRAETNKNKVAGTGLGLAIVKQILKRHAGNFTVTSSIEQGTSFTVFLKMESEFSTLEPAK